MKKTTLTLLIVLACSLSPHVSTKTPAQVLQTPHTFDELRTYLTSRTLRCVHDISADPLKHLTPDVRITQQTDADRTLLEKMRFYYFEKEDQTILRNTLNAITAHDPYEKRRRRVYKRCVEHAGAQEVILPTEDNYRISALYYKREQAPFNILYCTGYFRGQTPTKEWPAAFTQIFPEANILSYDWRGFADSSGTPSEFDTNAYRDVQAAIEFLKRQNDKPIFAVGFCFGSAVLLHATNKALDSGKPTADALVLNSTPTYMNNMKKRAVQLAPNWVLRKFFSYQLTQDLILTRLAGDLFDVEPFNLIKKIKLPMLFEYYTKDRSVPLHEAVENYTAAPHPCKMLVVSDIGGHVRIHAKAPQQYRQAFLKFIEKTGLVKTEKRPD